MLVFELQLGELLGVQVLEELRVVALKPESTVKDRRWKQLSDCSSQNYFSGLRLHFY